MRKQLKGVIEHQNHSQIVLVDAANRQPSCLSISGLESVYKYNFRGTTDVLVSYGPAVQAGMPEIGSLAAIEVKKDLTSETVSIIEGCLTLDMANQLMKTTFLYTPLQVGCTICLTCSVLPLQFSPQESAQACVALIALNLKSRELRPWVVLTDLNSKFDFYWMDGAVIYIHATDASCGWRIMKDLLRHDENGDLAPPTEQASNALGLNP